MNQLALLLFFCAMNLTSFMAFGVQKGGRMNVLKTSNHKDVTYSVEISVKDEARESGFPEMQIHHSLLNNSEKPLYLNFYDPLFEIVELDPKNIFDIQPLIVRPVRRPVPTKSNILTFLPGKKLILKSKVWVDQFTVKDMIYVLKQPGKFSVSFCLEPKFSKELEDLLPSGAKLWTEKVCAKPESIQIPRLGTDSAAVACFSGIAREKSGLNFLEMEDGNHSVDFTWPIFAKNNRVVGLGVKVEAGITQLKWKTFAQAGALAAKNNLFRFDDTAKFPKNERKFFNLLVEHFVQLKKIPDEYFLRVRHYDEDKNQIAFDFWPSCAIISDRFDPELSDRRMLTLHVNVARAKIQTE